MNSVLVVALRGVTPGLGDHPVVFALPITNRARSAVHRVTSILLVGLLRQNLPFPNADYCSGKPVGIQNSFTTEH